MTDDMSVLYVYECALLRDGFMFCVTFPACAFSYIFIAELTVPS